MSTDTKQYLAITGFMGVGKSSVARHLSHQLRCERIDLDHFIESEQNRKITEIIDNEGIESFRTIESASLATLLSGMKPKILSLGGGTWTVPANRELIRKSGYTVIWLESTFEHCWMNIKFSKKDRPLARDKAEARRLFEERRTVYCLADWHFIIRPEHSSYGVAQQICEEFF